MAISLDLQHDIENVLKVGLRSKFAHHKPEPAVMPFHTRLLGKDRMALFSFIHSLNTNFGTTIFEPVAKKLAASSFPQVSCHQDAGGRISAEAEVVIQQIMNRLTSAHSTPNNSTETEAIRSVALQGEMVNRTLTKVDIKLVAHDGSIYLIDLKTAKPNAGGFKEFKRTLLEWTAATLADNPSAAVHSLVAIPYNPYAPQPYNRWTMRGMLDLENELRVAEEFWDFLGGQGAYQELLDIFERVGIELREEIDAYFGKYARK